MCLGKYDFQLALNFWVSSQPLCKQEAQSIQFHIHCAIHYVIVHPFTYNRNVPVPALKLFLWRDFIYHPTSLT